MSLQYVQHVVVFLLQVVGDKVPADVKELLATSDIKAAFAIWTTTPWTIPANLAVAVNADLDYCLVRAEVRGSRHVQLLHKLLMMLLFGALNQGFDTAGCICWKLTDHELSEVARLCGASSCMVI